MAAYAQGLDPVPGADRQHVFEAQATGMGRGIQRQPRREARLRCQDVRVRGPDGWVGPAGLTDEMVSFFHDRFRRGMDTPVWRRFLERLGEADGYADGPGFQRAMDTLLDDVRAALRRS